MGLWRAHAFRFQVLIQECAVVALNDTLIMSSQSDVAKNAMNCTPLVNRAGRRRPSCKLSCHWTCCSWSRWANRYVLRVPRKKRRWWPQWLGGWRTFEPATLDTQGCSQWQLRRLLSASRTPWMLFLGFLGRIYAAITSCCKKLNNCKVNRVQYLPLG